MTAAEKRAARRARVLAGGENRLKLVTGQIASLKEGDAALEQEMDAALGELLSATDGSEAGEATATTDATPAAIASDVKFAPRPDPAQRRRDAALRRQKKEEVVEQLLAPRQSTAAPLAPHENTAPERDTAGAAKKTVAAKPAAPPTFSRHSLALKLLTLEEKAIALLLVAAALYLGERSMRLHWRDDGD